MDPVKTVIDTGGVLEEGIDFQDDELTFAGAETIPAGTILARDSVSLKLVKFVKGGSTNENGIPKTVLTYDVTASGAGDVPMRSLMKGKVNFNKVIIASDGDNSNVDAAVKDQLRSFDILVVDVSELNIEDN